MALKNFDFKQFLLAKGERVGLYACAGLAALLVGLSLFLPGHGFFSGSAAAKSKEITAPTEQVQRAVNDPSNKPKPEHLPPADSDSKLIAFAFTPIDADRHQLASLSPVGGGGDIGRRTPKVFNIDEAVASAVHVQVQSYILEKLFSSDPEIVLLEDASDKGVAGGAKAMGQIRDRFGSGPGGRGFRPPTMPGGPGGEGSPDGSRSGRSNLGTVMGRPGDVSGLGGEVAKKEMRSVTVRIRDLGTKGKGMKPAEQVRPMRMAVIEASFPYRAQVEEFRSKLGLQSAAQVISEASLETVKATDTTEARSLYSFRFLGFDVERREVGAAGKPVLTKDSDKEGWEKVNLAATYTPLMLLTGKRYEPEDPRLQPIRNLFKGLVMPRLKQFREDELSGVEPGAGGGTTMPGVPKPPAAGPGEGTVKPAEPAKPRDSQYPALVDRLPELTKTLKDLEGKNVNDVIAPPPAFDPRGLDFTDAGDDVPPAGGAGEAGSGERMPPPRPGFGKGTPGGVGMPPKGARPPVSGEGTPELAQPTELPKHCLVRIIDVTVQPGKRYEYRVKIRMANPNYNRKDVASPTYREKLALESAEWSKPIPVTVPDEVRYYVVDEKALADKPSAYRGPYWNDYINQTTYLSRDKYVLMQAHRWLDAFFPKGKEAALVGEWVVAERFPVARGEYVGRAEKVEVPVWRYTREEFEVLSGPAKPKPPVPGVDVDFRENPNSDLPEALLVDFRPEAQTYVKPLEEGSKAAPTTVTDVAAAEVLLLTPEGHLTLRSGAADAADEERAKRRQAVADRLKDLKDNKKKADPSKTTPFGGERPGGTGT